MAFDGMRKHLADDFDVIYTLDLGGNVRENPKLSGTTHNVFGIQVGVSINLFIKRGMLKIDSKPTEIFYARVDEFWRKEEKYHYLNSKQHYQNIDWQQLTPDSRYTWLTEGLHAKFDTFIPMGSKEAKSTKGAEVVFNLYSLGVATNRDILAYAFDLELLQKRVHTFIEIYNTTIDKKKRNDPTIPVESFIDTTDSRIKWTHRVKQSLKKLTSSTYRDVHFRRALYRPFCRQYLYFDHFWNERRYQQHRILPTPETESENRIICVSGIGGNKPFQSLMVDVIPDLHLTGDTQCFPFYTYNEDGTNRQENITDWALTEFRTHYNDDTISKWDIFHYNYALLHHPVYREKYEMNLKRDLPHIPFAEDFWGFANAGAALADLHINYESAPKYDGLEDIETPGMKVDWHVEKMKLSKDKTQLKYNDFLTLDGIPAEAFDYRLGNRSALEWVIDQYRVKVDKRSGIVNDPNREDQPRYIVDLVARVISVSLQTVKIVDGLPSL